ncbi:MAG: hypothetical protein HC893_04635 [Chloroflexaceae bacterium]|nr:hypothetical protein [Chloroflexaceae bacterium]
MLGLQMQPGDTSIEQTRVRVAPGTAVLVVAGPVEIDGQAWWQVRVFNQEGWSPAEALEIR